MTPMIIGLLSDTHGALARAIRALELLLQRNSEAIIHCGDIGSEEVLLELATLCHAHEVPLHAVLGNVDLFEPGLRDFRASDGARVWGEHAEVELAGKKTAILHGHEERRLLRAVQSGAYDYVFTGHTHEAADALIGNTRVINPGAVYRAQPPTVAVLNIATGHLEHITTH